MISQSIRRAFVALSALVLCVVYPLNLAHADTSGAVAHLTIYDAGIAEFHEERTVELQPGLNQLEWRSLMPKAYVRTLRVVAEGAEVVRQDITYDGTEVRNEKSPVLHLVLRSTGTTAGPRRVQVDYLAPGISWQNDYALVLEQTAEGAPPTAALLDSWVSIFNRTGTDVGAGTVDLIAGEIALRLEGSANNEYAGRRDVAQSNVAYDAVTESTPSVSAEVSGVSAFSRFRLGRDLFFNANAPVNRLPLFQRARLAVAQRNVFENEYSVQTLGRGGFTLLPRGLEVRLVAKNTTEAPMPAGEVTIYARQDDLVQVVGQDRIPLTPPNNEFSVTQGRSATVFGTRRIIERRQVEYRAQTGETRTKLITSIEVIITNRGTLPAEAYIREGIEPFADNQWTILTSSPQGERLGASAMQFKVQVPAGGKTTVTYTVETK